MTKSKQGDEPTSGPAGELHRDAQPLEGDGEAVTFGLFSRDDPKDSYRFNYSYVETVPLVDKLPPGEKPSLSWYGEVIWQVLRIVRNRLNWVAVQKTASEADGPLAFSEPEPDGLLELDHLGMEAVDLDALPLEVSRLGEADAPVPDDGGPMAFGGGVSALLEVGKLAKGAIKLGLKCPLKLLDVIGKAARSEATGRPQSAEDYVKMFTLLAPPWMVTTRRFLDDEVFAWLRVAGPNPLVIQGVSGPDASFPVTEAHYQAALLARQAGGAAAGPPDTLASAGAEGRLYLADYAALRGVESGAFPYPKHSFAPKALFVLPRGAGPRRLEPVAIQCGQDPREFAIFTPADGEGWSKARFAVQSADGNHHELVSHLGRTHLPLGALSICTRRQLDDDHPVSRLLVPHFEGTLAINDSAQSGMIAPGGPVDRSLAGSIGASRQVAVETYHAPFFNHGFLPRWIEERRLGDPDLDYPYRDDGLLVWGALERWVRAYVAIHYASDADVRADGALQAWAAEIVAEDGARLPDFGEDGRGRLSTVDYLVGALTMVIFTASAQHAVVNFGQGDLMTFALATPFASFAPAPKTHEEGREGTWLDMVAPLDLALFQAEFMNQLGGIYYTRLGQYKTGWFDSAAKAPLARLQSELEAIGATIEEKNQRRFAPFPFLVPARVPQSINI